jgi:hypothetical protein
MCAIVEVAVDPYSSTHSDPRSTTSSIHLHRRQRRRFIHRAPLQRSSAPSGFPTFDDFSLPPNASDGSGIVGLGSSWSPSSGCIGTFSHYQRWHPVCQVVFPFVFFALLVWTCCWFLF